MTKKVDLTICNRLIKERRDVNVYHHCNRSSHIISCNNSLMRAVKSMEADDYLHISVARGPGYLTDYCVLDLPSFMNFKISLTGEATLFHSDERILVKIPPGPPTWEIKMIISKQIPVVDSLNGSHVTIGDAEGWPDDLEETK